MNLLAIAALACVVVVAATAFKVWRITTKVSFALQDQLEAARRERDSYSDALATVIDLAERGDADGVVAHARQALEGGDYYGRLRAAQEALEAAEAALHGSVDVPASWV